MNTGARNIFLILTVFIIISVYIVFKSINWISDNEYIIIVPMKQTSFLINTEGCKIQLMDPYDPTIKDYLSKGSELKCRVAQDVVYAEEKTIFIDWSVVYKNKLPQLHHCTYDVIWRPSDEDKAHNFYKFVNESEAFDNNITVTEDFVRVQCFNRKKSVIYTNAFSFIHRKLEIEEKCNERRKKHLMNKEEELSVLMLGVDSVSRSNMIRYMPKTRSYLLNNMSAIEMTGYNKIADNTFVNIVPMTTGHFVKELPWTENMTSVPFDKYEFIWNKFSKQGYRTLYAEDAADIQAFDYGKSGFAKPPADYFNRPFAVALEQMSNVWNAGHNCVHGRPETKIILDYLNQFAHTFALFPTFSFTFITRLTHDYIPATRKADQIYYNFFKALNTDSTLNNTVIIFFSDHGIRFGRVRGTSIGRLEERLPFMFFIFPDWVLKKYPNLQKNLNTNSKRLTTPFDIYETLKDLLHFKPDKKSVTNKRGISLLNEVPTERTCDDAGILPHWCTCSHQKVISRDSKDVKGVAEKFVSEINKKIGKHPMCAKLILSQVKYASQLLMSDKFLSFERNYSDVDNKLVKYDKRVKSYIDYQLIIQTHPSDAVFEGTIRYNEENKDVKMLGDISRINMYGNQSYCIHETSLKKFCFCTEQIKRHL